MQWDSDHEAIEYLEENGYTLTSDFFWMRPEGRRMTAKERDALEYLIEEWDFGGVRNR